MRVAVFITFAVLIAPTALWPQQTPQLERDVRIRVTHGCEINNGSLTRCRPRRYGRRDVGLHRRVGSDTLLLEKHDGTTQLLIPAEAIYRTEMVFGQKSLGVSGMVTGLVVGVFGGAAIGYAATTSDWLSGVGAIFGAPVGGLVGMLGGGIIGALIKVDRWEEVPLGVLIGFAPQHDGRIGLALSVSF